MSLNINGEFIINSHENAKLLTQPYWLKFIKWREKKISYEPIFMCLESLINDLETRDNTLSIQSQINRFAQDNDFACIYRHLRDFGSLKHYNTNKDSYLDNLFKPIIKNLKEKDESQLKRLLQSLENNNLLEIFLEDKKISNIDSLQDILEIFQFQENSLLTRPDYLEAINFLKTNIKITLLNSPLSSIESNGLSKMLRIMIGTIMYTYYSFPNHLDKKESSKKILQSLKIGYYFGSTYPLVDNIFDSSYILSKNQKQVFANILTDAISNLGDSVTPPNLSFLRELYRCCLELKKIVPYEKHEASFNYIKIAHLAQTEDSMIDMNSSYDSNSLFTNIIIKAAFTRISIASLAGYPVDSDFIKNSLAMGFNNQMSNDFEGVVQDFQNNIATPYTLFFKRKIALNPLILTFDYYLFFSSPQSNHEIYIKACLLRFIETVSEFVKLNGINKYEGFINRLIDNTIFEDQKYLFYRLGSLSKSNIQVHQETLPSEYLDSCAKKYILKYQHSNSLFDLWRFRSEVMPRIEKTIAKQQFNKFERYALSGNCQRNRPFLCLLMGRLYGLEFKNLESLLRSVEYFHTASLILDDLPAQDNATFRRGKLTLHKKYGESAAQITAISLIAKGYNELGKIIAKDSVKLEIIRYASHICSSSGLCLGQLKDLAYRKNKSVELKDLIEIAYLKTGLAIEFCLVSVSIMAGDSSKNIKKLKLFAKYIGIAYQIKDDLNDAINSSKTGKDQFIDQNNKHLSFLYLLGETKAKKMLTLYKNTALKELSSLTINTNILKEFIEFLFYFI